MSPGREAAVHAAQQRMGELGLTQEALAKRARVDLSTINTFINGHTWPQIRTRAAIEVALEWPVGKLGRISVGDELDVEALRNARSKLLEALAVTDPVRMREAAAEALSQVDGVLRQLPR